MKSCNRCGNLHSREALCKDLLIDLYKDTKHEKSKGHTALLRKIFSGRDYYGKIQGAEISAPSKRRLRQSKPHPSAHQ